MSTFLRLMFSNVLDAYLSAIFSFVNIAKSFLLQVAYGLKLRYEIAFHKKLPLHADWEEVSCGRPVPRTQDQWGGRWSWLCSRLPDLYSVQTAQCTTHCSPVVSDNYHHSVVSVLLLCCRCQLNKMTPKLNQTCLVNVKERVSYLCLGKVYRWMDLNVMIT